MEVRILGPLEVRDGEATLSLGGGRQRAFLALLLLNAGRVVPVERLIDDIWGDDAPASASKSIQIFVSKLRKILPEGRLLTRPPGYVIELDAGELDLEEFERLLAGGRTAFAQARWHEAALSLHEAMSLWRGPALAEFTEPFARLESARLEELRLACLEERIEADLALGKHAELVGELELLIGRHALRERLRAQHMLALYRSGRHAEALSAYQGFRHLLDEELGIEPSQRLRDLERGILQQDPALEALPVSFVPGLLTESAEELSAMPTTESLGSPSRTLVGRDGELAKLRHLLDTARVGHRQMVFVSGRSGIGKTTLVRVFVGEAEAAGDLLVGHGQCFEQYGQREAYMPVLEALGRLCRGSNRQQLVSVLADCAPTWLSQLPGLAQSHGSDLGSLAVGATPDRMLRELVDALEGIAEVSPLALLLEDLHWSDPSTVDALGALARRADPARLLLVATYRPQDARAGSHPVSEAAQELEQRGLASELRLQALTPAAIADYLELRFAEHKLPLDLSELLHERTGGNPLFLEKVVDSWVGRGWIEAVDGIFSLQQTVAELSRDVPATVRQLVEHQLDELEPGDQELIEAMSAAGAECATAAVAAACGQADEYVEARLTELARQGRFVELLGEAAWPDGTISSRFGFVHDLDAEVAYARLPPGRRARLHRNIGACLESGYGEEAGEIASELATHLLRGREPARAISYLEAAANHALSRGGHREAIEHLETALDALAELPSTRERAERELALQIRLGNALITACGYAAPETKETYARARELCAELGEGAPEFLPVLYGLWNNEIVAARHRSARELADVFLQLAEERDENALVVAHRAVAWCLVFDGQLEAARGHLDEIMLRFDPSRHASLASFYGEDPGVAAGAALSRVLWLLGFPDQALKASTGALKRARALRHPLSLAYALFCDALLHQLRRETSAAGEDAKSAHAVASEFGIPHFQAWSAVLSGWAESFGALDEGIAATQAGLRAVSTTGSVAFLPHLLALSAEVQGRSGQTRLSLRTLDEALGLCDRNDERYYQPEIHRLRGELLLRPELSDPVAAEEALRQAIELSRAQQSRMFQLRSTVSLGRLLRDQGRDVEAREMLSALYGWFSEGFDTPDLRDASELLAELIEPRPVRA